MNRRMIVFAIGKLLSMTGFLLFIPVMISFIYRESQGLYFGIVGVVLLLLGFLISRKTPKKKNIYAREGFVIVALSWILVSAFQQYLMFYQEKFLIMWMLSLKWFQDLRQQVHPFLQILKEWVIQDFSGEALHTGLVEWEF